MTIPYELFKVLMLLLFVVFSNSCFVVIANEDLMSVRLIEPISQVKIQPDNTSMPESIGNQILLRVCRDEFEPFSFVVTSHAAELEINSITVSDLENASYSNAFIESENVNIRVVKAWYQEGSAWENIHRTNEKVLVPELLLKDDSIIHVDHVNKSNSFVTNQFGSPEVIPLNRSDEAKGSYAMDVKKYPIKDASTLQPFKLEPFSNKQVWGVIHVPTDARSGAYTGLVTIHANDNHVEQIKITVEVLPFELEKPKLNYGIYYRGQLNEDIASSFIGLDWKTREQLKLELKNISDHGFDIATVYQTLHDFNDVQEVLSIHSELYPGQNKLFYLGFNTGVKSKNTLQNILHNVEQVMSEAKKYGFDDIYFYGIDEGNARDIAVQRNVWDQVRKLGGKILVAGNKKNIFLATDSSIDTYALSGPTDKFLIKKVRDRSKTDIEILSYANPQGGVENPYIYRKNFGILLWRDSYDGALIYSYQHPEGMAWSDFDGRIRDLMFVYPTINGVIETIAWEGMREAIDDVRYLTTLEKQMEITLANAKSSSVYRDAKDFLDGLEDEDVIKPALIREEAINHIMKLFNDAKSMVRQ